MKKALFAAAAALLCSTAALAEEAGPKVPFDAVYKSTSPAGSSEMRMASDGKGKMRTETSAGGQKMVSIMDYPNKMMYSIMETQKMIMKMPLKITNDVHDEESAKKAKAKSLGAKNVAGHPCHGWQYTTDGGTTTVWTGDDINYFVKSETETKDGMKMTTELVSFNKKGPAADAFNVPSSGYKVMAMPGR